MVEVREEIKQIGHGSLHVITSSEEDMRSEGRTLSLSVKILWFEIAHLDEKGNIIEGKAMKFEGPSSLLIADFLSGALQDISSRPDLNSIRRGISDVEVVRLDDKGVLIKKGNSSVEVDREDIDELADKLGFVSAYHSLK